MDTHKFFSFLFALAGTKEMIPCELGLMFSKENRFIRRLDPSHVPPPSPYSSVWTVIRLTSCQIALLDFASFSFFLFFFFHLSFKSNRIKGKEKNVSDIFFFLKNRWPKCGKFKMKLWGNVRQSWRNAGISSSRTWFTSECCLFKRRALRIFLFFVCILFLFFNARQKINKNKIKIKKWEGNLNSLFF